MDKAAGKKPLITRMRPDPDFKYLARRVRQMEKTGVPLSPDVERDPGEIPGFYAEEHGE